MATTRHDTLPPIELRQSAEFKLRMGLAPGTRGWTIGVPALTLLHKLANDPRTAADSLKLLHELQVHQVELDLQHEELEDTRRALEQRADHYAALFALAPVAYFTVDRSGRVIEGNLAAARLLGLERDDLPGLGIDSLVAPGSGAVLRVLLEQARGSGTSTRGRAPAHDGAGWLELVASTAPPGQHYLLVAQRLDEARLPAASA